MKKGIAIAACLWLCALALPQTVNASEITEASDLEWVLTESETKTFRPSEDEDYELLYQVDEEGIVITGVKSTLGENEKVVGELVIPGKIDGMTVYKIGDEAFASCNRLYGDLTVPEGVKVIGKKAFMDCTGFAGNLCLPEGLITIDDDAFLRCKNLQYGDIPESVETIGNNAFQDVASMCLGQKFSANLKSIGMGAFFYTDPNWKYRTCYFYITKNTKKIGYAAFAGNPKKYKICAPKNSVASMYAQEDSQALYEEVDWLGILSAQSIEMSDSSVSVAPGEQITITATVLPDSARNKTVNWTSDNEGVATVDEEGVVTAVNYGVATITATTVNGISSTCKIQVEDHSIAVNEVRLDKTEVTLYLWQEETVTATVLPVDATDKTLVWTSSDETIATVTKGKIKAVGYGTVEIKATSADGIVGVCKVTVEKEFPFQDVNTSGWEYKGINYAYQKGLMSGTTPTIFKPFDKLSRSQFATVLYSYAGKPSISFSNRFTDVPNGQWYSNAVIWAADNGVASGYPDGSFGIQDNITREQFVLMLYKYAKSNGKVTSVPNGSLNSYSDASSVHSWAKEAVLWAVQNELISGKPSGNGQIALDPLGNTTRAECATIMRKFDLNF